MPEEETQGVLYCAPRSPEAIARFTQLLVKGTLGDAVRYDAVDRALRESGIAQEPIHECSGLHREMCEEAVISFADELCRRAAIDAAVLAALRSVVIEVLRQMTVCTESPHLSDDQVRRYVACAATSAVEAYDQCAKWRVHLGVCASCDRRVAAIARSTIKVF